MGTNADIVQRGWEAVGSGDRDALVADYTEDMRFIMPGQTDVLEGQGNFRQALEGIHLRELFAEDPVWADRACGIPCP